MVDLQDLAKEFSTVIVAATDVQGRLFGRRVPVNRFLNELKDGIDICTCALAWDIAQDLSRTMEFEGGRRGWNDFRIIPALETLRRYPGAADTAICMADVVDEDGVPALGVQALNSANAQSAAISPARTWRSNMFGLLARHTAAYSNLTCSHSSPCARH